MPLQSFNTEAQISPNTASSVCDCVQMAIAPNEQVATCKAATASGV